VSGSPWDAVNGPTNGASIGAGTARVNGVTVNASNLFLTASAAAGLVITNGGKLYTSAATSAIGQDNSDRGNSVLVTGSGSVWDNGAKDLRLGNNNTTYDGVLTVTVGGVVTNVSNLYVGLQGGTNNWLNVTAGGKVYATNLTVGNQNSLYNGLLVSGTNALLDNGAGAITIGANNGTVNNQILISNGGVVTNASSLVTGNGGSDGNNVEISNGGKLYLTGAADSRIGNGSGGNLGNNNTVLVTGTDSLWNGGGNVLNLGYAGFSNTVTVAAGGVMTNTFLYVGRSAASGNSIVVTNGGKVYASNESNVGYAHGAYSNSIQVTGAGSLWDNGGKLLYIGGNGLVVTGNTMVITAGGVVRNISDLRINNVTAGQNDNDVRVTDGGVLESAIIRIGLASTTNGTLTITDGGVLQFLQATPNVIINNAAGGNALVMDGGILSFRGITNANVAAAYSAWTWSGTNTFRLNAATNATSPSQAYTFTDTLGATNYATLSLINGAMWRGGTATIGAGGSLEVGTGTNYITALTLTSGGSLDITFNGPNDFSRLNVSGALTLGGATLKLTLNAAPERNVEYQILSGTVSDTFGNSSVTANYAGTDYVMTVRHTATGVSIADLPRGTVISIR
jgi:T5SS/PEP-CTERM-associated repeat protein